MSDPSAVIPATIAIPERSEGIRIVVRPYDVEDAPALREAVEESRDRIRAWLPWWNEHRSLESTIDFCARVRARWITREDLAAGVFERESGRLLGGTGLHRINWAARAFEVGYWVRTSAEGKGYVTEAAAVVTRLAFETLSANRVEVRCDPRNARSKAVIERLGFVHEGTLRRQARATDGSMRDTHVYSMLREEYDRSAQPWADLFRSIRDRR
jgi:RimJ/RimL family protein N-acetyltransferase